MHEWVDHTSELELRVRAPSPEQAVSDATAALGELLGDATGDAVERELEVAAGDPAGLLAAWLEELVFLSEREQLVPEAARDVELDDGRLRARLVARSGTPAYLVKAVTYHRLAFERANGEWAATVVLDV